MGRAPVTPPFWRSPLVVAALAAGAAGLYWLAQGRVLRGAVAVVVALLVVTVVRSRRRRYAVFALVTVLFATVLPIAAIAGLDLYLHQRYSDRGGYNIWGYRGPALGAKAAGERRLAVLGGSTAFGYGVRSEEAFPAALERTLRASRPHEDVTVVNLAWNGEGANAFPFTLEAYDYLDADVVLLYSGYNDFALNTQDFRRQSAIFRATGYMPILPVLPIKSWLRVHDLSDTRLDDQVIFQPNIADRSAAHAADMALQITQALERQIARLAQDGPARPVAGDADDCGRWTHYCQSIHESVRIALAQGRHAVVITEPYFGGGGAAAALQINQQSTMKNMLAARFPGEPRLHYVNMGRAVDLRDPALCYDGLHLTPAGNARLAASLAEALTPILDVVAAPIPDSTPFVPLGPVRADDGDVDEAYPSHAEAAAARGQFRAARGHVERLADTTGTATPRPGAEARARLAIAEWAAGLPEAAVVSADDALREHRGPGVVWAAAVVHALAGDVETARSLAGEFHRMAPQRLAVERLWQPILDAARDHREGKDDSALRRLDRTLAFDRASFWPRYLRGVIHLRHGRGFEAEEEFLRILAQPDLGAQDPLYVTSLRHLASARVQQGVAALYGETYQAFFKAWLQADPDIPLLEEAKREYVELRRSIGMPPLPF